MEPTALSQLRTGCYDIDARIDDMNANGVLGSLCFPSVPGFVGELFGKQAKAGNRELAITMLRAYNDWHIDDWCGKYPGRFIPLAIPPIWDPEEMGREVRRVAKKGCHAITFADTPGGLGYPSLHSAALGSVLEGLRRRGHGRLHPHRLGHRDEPAGPRSRRSRS